MNGLIHSYKPWIRIVLGLYQNMAEHLKINKKYNLNL